MAAIGVAACDVYEFGNNPAPRFEQTWNLPAPSMSISVAELLPTTGEVTILPDSSAFELSVGGASISRVVGNDCAACVALNGTNAPKPAFVLNAGNSTPLPTDVVSAAIVGGQVDVQLTNNMSFDPLFVRTNPGPQTQGFMLIVVRSGSVVLGRDSVNGATTPFPPGTPLNRTILFTTGTVTASITVDVTMDSPLGDHDVPINSNGTLDASATVPTLTVASVGLNVPNRTMQSESDSLDLGGLGDISDNVVSGTLEMTITNPFAVTGAVNVRFAYGPGPSDAVTETFMLPTGAAQVRTVTLDSADMSNLFGAEEKVAFEIGGAVTSAAPITVTPTMAISMSNRLILTIRTGGGN
ncbi:MAG: hypothetical protein WD801_10605 [Gemmatimonadaceae bacterium]